TESLRKRMGLDASKLLLTFQSRFGFAEWLQPYTDKTIEKLAKDGVKRIAVVTPGFSADWLETLEEIAQENAEIFQHNGGEQVSGDGLSKRREAGHGRDSPAGSARPQGLNIASVKYAGMLPAIQAGEHLVAARTFPSYTGVSQKPPV